MKESSIFNETINNWAVRYSEIYIETGNFDATLKNKIVLKYYEDVVTFSNSTGVSDEIRYFGKKYDYNVFIEALYECLGQKKLKNGSNSTVIYDHQKHAKFTSFFSKTLMQRQITFNEERGKKESILGPSLDQDKSTDEDKAVSLEEKISDRPDTYRLDSHLLLLAKMVSELNSVKKHSAKTSEYFVIFYTMLIINISRDAQSLKSELDYPLIFEVMNMDYEKFAISCIARNFEQLINADFSKEVIENDLLKTKNGVKVLRDSSVAFFCKVTPATISQYYSMFKNDFLTAYKKADC